jgi:glycosyltransferase involved in cell wall biosynthesis
MKVLVVNNYYKSPGGEDAVFAAEVDLLSRYGHEVITYTKHNEAIEHANAALVAAAAVWSRESQTELSGVLSKAPVDVVHFHNTFPLISPSAYYACRDAGVPVVQTLHNYRLLCPVATLYRDGRPCEDCLDRTVAWPGILHACYHKSRVHSTAVVGMLALHRYLRTWQRSVNVYIALTRFARIKFSKGGIPAEKIVVKPNFVARDPGIGERGGRYGLFVGRLTPEKGVWTLLRAWGQLSRIPLKVVGAGGEGDAMRDFVAANGLESVELLGRKTREEVLDLMKQARFLVFPSEWYEGFPVTIVEAFACGLPVIAARLGSMAEIVDDGRTGLLFPPGDCAALAAAVTAVWEDRQGLERLAQGARTEYERVYTPARNYRKLLEIYGRAMRTRPALGGRWAEKVVQ